MKTKMLKILLVFMTFFFASLAMGQDDENPVDQMQGAVEGGVSWIKRDKYPSLGNAELDITVYQKKDPVKKQKQVSKEFTVTVTTPDTSYTKQEVRQETIDYMETPGALSFCFGIDSRYEVLRYNMVDQYGHVVSRSQETLNRLRQGYFGIGWWTGNLHFAALAGAERRTNIFYPTDSTWATFETDHWSIGGMASYKSKKIEVYAKAMYNPDQAETIFKVKVEAKRLIGIFGLGGFAERNFPSGDEYAGYFSVGLGQKIFWGDVRFGGSYNPVEATPAFFAGIFIDIDKRNTLGSQKK